jgi:putative spermidine/putrescine transport system permease protein
MEQLYRILNWCLVVLALLIVGYLILPIVFVVLMSLTSADYASFPPPSLSLRWYESVLGSQLWQDSFRTSLVVAFVASLAGTLMGLLAALALVRTRFHFKGAVYVMILAPMFVPGIVTGLAIYFQFIKLVGLGSITMLMVSHSIQCIPLATIILIAVLRGIDIRQEQAAASLGANPVTVLRRITIPLVLPGFIAAVLFSFLRSFDEFYVALFYSSQTFTTLPIRIWRSLLNEIDPSVAAVSTLLVGLTVVIVLALVATIGARAVVNRGRMDVA